MKTRWVNTRSRVVGNREIITLHDTDIVELVEHPEGIAIILDRGGYYTATTKRRMNQYISQRGWFVFQKKRKRYVEGMVSRRGLRGAFIFVYKDGMTLYPNGSVSFPYICENRSFRNPERLPHHS